jgi:hypothetical protein
MNKNLNLKLTPYHLPLQKKQVKKQPDEQSG